MTTADTDPRFEALLGFLKEVRAIDFTGYKRGSLLRRVRKRMQAVEIADYDAYREHLEAHPAEFDALLDTILINVTTFFRDRDAWDVLAGKHLPALLARKGSEEPVRVWSAGCATGQETYTLVMALAEVLGHDAFRERVKLYATDLDDAALAHARRATYPAGELDGLPEGYRDRYFEPAGDRAVFRPDLRRQVIFGRHDLVQDAPISHVDLLACRNVLMYFNAEVQARVLARFHFALRPEGLLFLGKAEMMRSHASLFAPVHLPARIFRRAPAGGARERLPLAAAGPGRRVAGLSPAQQVALRDAALNALPAAQLVVSADGDLVLVNDAARRLFSLAPGDVGRPLQDLRVSYRPVELRSRIEQVLAERRPVHLSGVEHTGPEGEARGFDVQVAPLPSGENGVLGVSVTFLDVTRYTGLQAEVEATSQALETAFEELQSTNEELETTNEELQSTIEELETTNEELQSTNEELETLNEELQSTNEELETLNEELRRRTGELHLAHASLQSVLARLDVGVVVVDREMLVRVWNRWMEERWGLRARDAVEKPLLHLEVGLPVERLKAAVRGVLDGRSPTEEVALDAVNHLGIPVHCHVSVTPLVTASQEVRESVILVDERERPG